MEKQYPIESDQPKPAPEAYSRAKVKLSRAQIFRLLQEENLGELENWQPPIYTHYINPNLP